MLRTAKLISLFILTAFYGCGGGGGGESIPASEQGLRIVHAALDAPTVTVTAQYGSDDQTGSATGTVNSVDVRFASPSSNRLTTGSYETTYTTFERYSPSVVLKSFKIPESVDKERVTAILFGSSSSSNLITDVTFVEDPKENLDSSESSYRVVHAGNSDGNITYSPAEPPLQIGTASRYIKTQPGIVSVSVSRADGSAVQRSFTLEGGKSYSVFLFGQKGIASRLIAIPD
jgi:hypothetical protein